ncbi:DUF4160 domain-containing protein [Bradyrhizobium manausense]|uniref:DUF4160 domain-containing protein n=1 Tax=Bradyrhizobium manausense TaxID=989370 RepID=UPI001BAAF819|nr:DUF4160 domain-containing protein [Bradyrhizobium manausense]MBR0726773.1 DUF4160 domain-containing protein [Bradyrhizobium manausense]
MPTVLRWGAYRAFFYSADGVEPPHVHVTNGDNEAKFWLDDLSVAVNLGYAPHEIRAIIRELQPNRAELLKAWHEYFGD